MEILEDLTIEQIMEAIIRIQQVYGLIFSCSVCEYLNFQIQIYV